MMRPSRWTRLVAGAALTAVLAGCTPAEEALQNRRHTLVVGLDVSGSFRSTRYFDEAVDFAAHYIYGHLNGLGELEVPTALFVGSVGGVEPGEAKTFHPIHDFQGKGADEIAADLRAWFPARDRLTDFNTFFARTAELLQQRGMVLMPLDIVLLTDGVPDITAGTAAGAEGAERYRAIDLSPLEYLSRSVTVRVLYPDPTVAVEWERQVPRRRVRMWTLDGAVMTGWRAQVDTSQALSDQQALWTWVEDNVDFRVRRQRIF